MFDFILKKKTVTVDCFTDNPAIFEFFPIQEANKCYPSWWKSMNSQFVEANRISGIEHEIPTLKRCDGLLSLYSKGFCIPLWSDLILETNGSNEFRYQYSSDENHPIVSHSRKQLGETFSQYQHLKVLSPWMIEEKTGVNFLFSQASWNLQNRMFDMHILPGVINFRDQSSSHINMFVPNKPNRFEFKAGEILVHIIPLTSCNIKLKHHLITNEEYKNKMLRYSFMSSFMGRYKKNVRRK